MILFIRLMLIVEINQTEIPVIRGVAQQVLRLGMLYITEFTCYRTFELVKSPVSSKKN